MRLIYLPLFIFALFVLTSQKEAKVRIVHADFNLGRKINNEQLRILKGNVHVIKDSIQMFCDSALYFDTKDKLELLGRVLINNGKRKLQAKKIIYFPDQDLAECIGYVRVGSKDDSLFAHKLIYNLKRDEGTATDSVFMLNKKEQVTITGETGYYSKDAKYFRVIKNAHFIQQDTTQDDSFQVYSHKIEYYGDSLNQAVASDSVIITQGDFKAKADTARYFKETELAWLNGNPIVWVENSELTGKRIKAVFDSSKIENIYIYEDARAKTLNDSVNNEYNVLTGKTIQFFVTNNKPQLIIARDNATSIYYLAEGADQGSNFSTSDSIYVFFKEGKLDSIEIIGGAEGIYYPDSYKGKKKFGN